jgi:hypothetical protein
MAAPISPSHYRRALLSTPSHQLSRPAVAPRGSISGRAVVGRRGRWPASLGDKAADEIRQLLEPCEPDPAWDLIGAAGRVDAHDPPTPVRWRTGNFAGLAPECDDESMDLRLVRWTHWNVLRLFQVVSHTSARSHRAHSEFTKSPQIVPTSAIDRARDHHRAGLGCCDLGGGGSAVSGAPRL